MSPSRMWWMAHNFAADIRSAVRAAVVAFRDDWRSSQSDRALVEKYYDREAMMAGEWHE